MKSPAIEAALVIDRELVVVARKIRVLSSITWPAHLEDEFLSGWSAGRPELPKVPSPRVSLRGETGALEALMGRCDRVHPLGSFLWKTARSYLEAARMLEGAGTEEFTRHSIALYGRPDDRYRTQDVTGLSAAEFLLRTTDALLGGHEIPPCVADIPAEVFAERLRRAIDEFFVEDQVAVVVDPGLASKAIAGSKRVRVRAGALFTEVDFAQLLHHEALVHTLTIINGKKQPHLRCLGLGAPRTTRTQEGIAVLAELATMSMDIQRLRRIALRVRTLDLALSGADFIEVFRAFLDAGQTESESYKSAQRLFRGGDVRGGVAFTKDCVYLKGLLEVHTLLRLAIRDNRPQLVRHLFAGRLTIGDVVELAPFFESGLLAGPRYVPPWASDLGCVAASLAYSAFLTHIDLSAVGLEGVAAAEESWRE
jgi:uncharacterized protein (TIGR02421 family)